MNVSVDTTIPSLSESLPLQRNDRLVCETCGVAGAFEIGDHRLCDSCYQECGACCQGSDGEESVC